VVAGFLIKNGLLAKLGLVRHDEGVEITVLFEVRRLAVHVRKASDFVSNAKLFEEFDFDGNPSVLGIGVDFEHW
jgi:hypothetical protein